MTPVSSGQPNKDRVIDGAAVEVASYGANPLAGTRTDARTHTHGRTDARTLRTMLGFFPPRNSFNTNPPALMGMGYFRRISKEKVTCLVWGGRRPRPLRQSNLAQVEDEPDTRDREGRN